ncbi:MAG: SDR family NAD(P)-dependent oxidoreductase [Bauldia sp.]|jgi:NAD(P)-dependent dehydrogenase (short-subunit alcohol dehydrogenase family)|nr:SDR family NAD(P)-dependent oxidoreductase [Bauldia sp.]
MPSNSVLITGCSTGIGRAAALRFARAGIPVWASARRLSDIEDLVKEGCRIVELDVTDEASRVAAVARVTEVEGSVGALVNNAGYAELGPMEEVSIEALRRQFETNVFGAVRLSQLVLPGMRRAGHGTIVNVSSVGGLVTFLGGGAYHMSKFALESFSDALRAEVGRFGIRVVVVEPFGVRTAFQATSTAGLGEREPGPYDAFNRNLHRMLSGAGESRVAVAPEAIAETIFAAVTARRPRARYNNFSTRMLARVRRLVPDRLWDRLSGRMIRAE